MGLFDFFSRPSLQEGLDRCKADPKGVLVDVRTPEEYEEGHIPGSRNLPLDELVQAKNMPDRNASLYLYCHNGARSRQAAAMLKRMGYWNVTNIGGLMGYRGTIEGGTR